MPYNTAGDVIYQRLAADAPTSTAVGGRINPQFGTQEPVVPLIRFTITGADQSALLSGVRAGRPQLFTLSVESVANSEASAADVGKKAAAALCPDGAFQEKANGVHGIFPGDVSQTVTEDAYRVYAQEFRVYFQPAG